MNIRSIVKNVLNEMVNEDLYTNIKGMHSGTTKSKVERAIERKDKADKVSKFLADKREYRESHLARFENETNIEYLKRWAVFAKANNLKLS